LDFILHIPYAVDACALPNILPSLSFTGMMYYCTSEKKPTLTSTFRLIWISLPHIVVKRVPNSTARFRCVFGSTDGPHKVRRKLRIPPLILII